MPSTPPVCTQRTQRTAHATARPRCATRYLKQAAEAWGSTAQHSPRGKPKGKGGKLVVQRFGAGGAYGLDAASQEAALEVTLTLTLTLATPPPQCWCSARCAPASLNDVTHDAPRGACSC